MVDVKEDLWLDNWVGCGECKTLNEISSTKCKKCGRKFKKRYEKKISTFLSYLCLLLLVVCFLMLILAIGYMPGDYYVYLRVAVFLTSCCLLVLYVMRKNALLFVLALPVLIVFNPISPIYLHDKSLWQIIDFFAALHFIISAFYINFDYLDSKIPSAVLYATVITGGVILVMMYFWTSANYTDSPEEAYAQHLMLRNCAISIAIMTTVGMSIFLGINEKKK